MDRVQLIKRESSALGGDDLDAEPWPAPIAPQEDAIEAAGVYLQDVSNRDENVLLSRAGNNMTFKDVANSTINLVNLALLTGRPGGQTLIGGTGAGDDLTLTSTSNATKGHIFLGSTSAYDEVNERLGIGVAGPTEKLEVAPNTDVSAVIGRAKIGYRGVVGTATFAHYDYFNTTNYAFMQAADGQSFMNAPTGGSLNFRINNSQIGIWNASALQLDVPLWFDGSATVIDRDGGGNLSFTDTVTGTKTLAQLAASEITISGTPADNQIAVWASPSTVEGTSNLTFNGTTLYANANVGIKTSTVPHSAVGYAMLALDGTASSASGPHVQYTVSTDNYPVVQQLNWSHDNIGILLDCYYDGNFRSSDAGSNFVLRKTSDKFQVLYDSGIAAGSVITWNDGIILTTSGMVAIGTSVPDSRLHVYNASAGTVAAAAGTLVTIENSSTNYLSFLTPNTATSGILFGDPENNAIGSVTYNHSSNTLSFTDATAGTKTLAQLATISGTPVNNQLAIWTSSSAVEGTSALTYDGSYLFVYSAAYPRFQVNSTTFGVTGVNSTSAGVDLISVTMDASNRYTPSVKFMSTDPQFTSENPKLLAFITGRATETYASDTDAGMDLEFWASPINGGATNTADLAMTVKATAVQLSVPLWFDNSAVYIDRNVNELEFSDSVAGTKKLADLIGKTGSPLNSYLAVWSGSGTITGYSDIFYGGTYLRTNVPIQIDNSATYIDRDGSGNLTFTDAVTGTKTLAQLTATGVLASGTPVDNQIAVWTNSSTIEGTSSLTFDGATFTVNTLTFNGTTLKVDAANAVFEIDADVGTGARQALLNLIGDSNTTEEQAFGFIDFSDQAASRARLVARYDSGSGNYRLDIGVGTVTTPTLSIKSGSVGINNVTSPDSSLHVGGGAHIEAGNSSVTVATGANLFVENFNNVGIQVATGVVSNEPFLQLNATSYYGGLKLAGLGQSVVTYVGSNSVLYVRDGYIGVNSYESTAMLELRTNGTLLPSIRLYPTIFVGDPYSLISVDAGGHLDVQSALDGSSNNNTLRMRVRTTDGITLYGNDRIRMGHYLSTAPSTGVLYIGENTPGVSNIDTNADELVIGNSSGHCGMTFAPGSTNNSFIVFGDATSDPHLTAEFDHTNLRHKYRFFGTTANTEVMTMMSTGSTHALSSVQIRNKGTYSSLSSAALEVVALTNDIWAGHFYGDSTKSGINIETAGDAALLRFTKSTSYAQFSCGSSALTLAWGTTTHMSLSSSGIVVGVGGGTAVKPFEVNADSIRVQTSKTPASSSASGAQGEIAWDSNYIYVCVATNTWRRASIFGGW